MMAVTGRLWTLNIISFVLAIGLGVAFIATSMSKSFYKWRMNACDVTGDQGNGVLNYEIDLTVDIGWRQMTATYVDPSAEQYCFEDVGKGGVYDIGDFEDNSASAAGFGMAASWAIAVLVALFTTVAMLKAIGGNRKHGVSLVTLMNLMVLMTLGVIAATTVFWWMVEGKFGARTEALIPRLRELVLEAADKCNDEADTPVPCIATDYDIITPGWSLVLGITSMFLYGIGAVLMWMMAARVQSLNNMDGPEAEATKIPTGDFIVDKQMGQSEDKVKSKDGRSARTGVRSAPSSTIHAVNTPDPMTYALEGGGEDDDEDLVVDEEDEVTYKNHQVHHNVINHSQANRTQEVVDSRRQQQYQRGYSRGASGNSFRSGMGGESFDERSEAGFSDASSARYYGQHQGRYRSESSSRGESFEENQ